MPAINGKTYVTRGLLKPALNERGTLLGTHGLYGDAPVVIVASIAYIYGLLHPFIGRLRATIHRGA